MPFGSVGIQQSTNLILLLLVYVAMPALSKPPTNIDYYNNYYNLTHYLFEGYKKEVPPALNISEPVEIDIIFILFQIIDIDEQNQKMKANARLWIWWNSYLNWTESEFGNIRTIIVNQGSIWVPDIVVGNTVTTQTKQGYKDLQVRIYSDGYVDWAPTAVFETSCDIDVTYYPFDTQVCSIVFTSAQSTSSELKIITYPNDFNFSSPDGIWDVLNSSTNDEKWDLKKAGISINLQLKRRPTFYILNIILPLVTLAMTSSLVFALPAESGEKMSLSITVLLAFAVYLTLVTGSMPKTSLQVSLVMLYILFLMALTALSVVLSVFILKLHHRPSDKPLGRKATKMIILLQKLMCSADLRQPVKVEVKTSYQNNTIAMVGQRKTQMNKSNTISPCDNSQESDESSRRSTSITRSCRSSEVNHVNGQQAAETLSDFLFIVFLFLIVASTIIGLVVLVVGGARQEENTRLT